MLCPIWPVGSGDKELGLELGLGLDLGLELEQGVALEL
jgi:hypothetical protein